jgi:hypothetical protein
MWAAPAIGGNGGAVVGFSLPAAAPPENGTRVVRSERPAADDDASRRVVNGHRRTRAAR